jgi:NAD(P)-dependent dehydrogenase (short-subunit alcohol dehydrogenase family)
MSVQTERAVTVVTGAAGGIGRALVAALTELGHTLVLADLNTAYIEAQAREICQAGGKAEALHLDIVSPDAARHMAAIVIERFGRIDNLVHAGGIDAPRGRIWELDDAEWRQTIDVDLNGAFWCAKAVLPRMLQQQSGRIVFIGSVAGRASSLDTSAAYNAAKAGVNGLAIGLSAQVEAQGVRVNVVAPGPTGTGNAMSEEERSIYRRQYPLGEGGTQPVVEACLYLLGPGGAWISGSVLNISGGRMRG